MQGGKKWYTIKVDSTSWTNNTSLFTSGKISWESISGMRVR